MNEFKELRLKTMVRTATFVEDSYEFNGEEADKAVIAEATAVKLLAEADDLKKRRLFEYIKYGSMFVLMVGATAFGFLREYDGRITSPTLNKLMDSMRPKF